MVALPVTKVGEVHPTGGNAAAALVMAAVVLASEPITHPHCHEFSE
jgi:hypothetical protein